MVPRVPATPPVLAREYQGRIIVSPKAFGTKIYYPCWVSGGGDLILSDSPFFLDRNKCVRWVSERQGPQWRFAIEIKWRRIIA